MGIIVDLIILAIILLSTFLAYKKGLISLMIQLCAFIITIVITLILYKPISNFVINTTNIDETIENAIYENVNEMIEKGETNEMVEMAKNEMLPQTVRTLSVNIVTGALVIILFIGTRIVLKLINGIADMIAKLPIINQFNKLGGIVYGILRGIIIVYFVLLIATIPNKINPENTLSKSIEQSYMGKIMYENNIFNVFFS